MARSLYGLLKPKLPELVIVDGDEIRKLFGDDLGYTELDRVRQIQRIQFLARMLDKQKFIVVTTALYAHPHLLKWNRDNFTDYFEIYLSAPLRFVQARDAKELYSRAARGEMPNVVGIDVPWHEPQSPDLVLDATSGASPWEMTVQAMRAIPRLASLRPELQ